MKGKVRNAIIIAAGVLILTVMLTVVLYYYNDKVMRDNAWVFSVDEPHTMKARIRMCKNRILIQQILKR